MDRWTWAAAASSVLFVVGFYLIGTSLIAYSSPPQEFRATRIDDIERRLDALELQQRGSEPVFDVDEDALYEREVREVLEHHNFDIDEVVEHLLQAHHRFPPICLDVD